MNNLHVKNNTTNTIKTTSDPSQWQAKREEMAKRYDLPLNFAQVRYLGKNHQTDQTGDQSQKAKIELLASLSVHMLNYYSLANFIMQNDTDAMTIDQVRKATSTATLENMTPIYSKQIFQQLADALGALTANKPNNWRELAKIDYEMMLSELDKQGGRAIKSISFKQLANKGTN